MNGLRRMMVWAGLAAASVGAFGAGCSGSGQEVPEATTDADTVREASSVHADPATALRLRRLADSTVTAAVRAFGPAEGLPLDELGARLYRTRGCIDCHGPEASNPVGPSLIDAFGTLREVEGRPPVLMDLDYINVALMRPDALIAAGYPSGEMPDFEGTLYPREVLALAVYLQSISAEPDVPTERGVIAEMPADEPVERVESPLIPEAEPRPATEEAPVQQQRADGRPDWWFDGVRREDGRVWLCVEALGPSFADARAAALDRGQTQLAERLGLSQNTQLRDTRVKFIWVTPLPNRGSERRYAAYAMMSALPD